ncbi:MAG: TOBE domain-containing protein [Kiritimatiellia bacterium]
MSAGVASVRVGAAILSAPASPELADDVLVSIRGEEVTLERKGGTTGSMQNRLIARVVSVQFGSPLLRVELDAGFPLLAYIARPVYEELALRPGSTVTAVIKVPGVHLIKPQTGLKRLGTTRGTVAEQQYACDDAARRELVIRAE